MSTLRFWLLCVGWAACGLGASLRGDGFSAPFVYSAGADEGEVLLGELNCLACHSAAPEVARRLSVRVAPVLGAEGLRLTPQWLRAWLLHHEATKPGSAMPDLLAGLEATSRGEASESLVHYLISIQPPGEPEGASADPARIALGRDLYHSLGCVACHAPETRVANMTDDIFNRAVAGSIPLGDLSSKYYISELARFLRDPVKHRPGGRMPSLNLSLGESQAIATYLLRAQAPALLDSKQSAATIAGLKWEYYEASFGGVADFDKLSAKAAGDTLELTAKLAQRGESFGLRFTGLIEVPADGDYTFWTQSDDGSALDVDGQRIVDNDGDHAPVERSGKVKLTKGLHGFEVRFYQNGAGFEFKVRWAGPGFARQAIPAAAFKRIGVPMRPVGATEFAVDAAKTAKGREWFAKLNCAACHRIEGVPATSAKPLLEIAAHAFEGCLADRVPAKAPRYNLSANQRTALRKTLAAAASLSQPLQPAQQIALTMTRLNCFACHTRDGVGGPAATGHDGWFRLVGEADLGEEGRLPPHLNAVGGKLRPAWTAQVLAKGIKVRSYMATRMPSFWPDGKAVNNDILNGSTDAQIRAIWAWMQGGVKAEVPTGLVRARKEIVVDREAVIYRNFVEGAGSRAIAVGYPERASLAFDANQLRLALIWQGPFIDASRHSTDRGTGYEPPLGDHVVRLPEGPAFAVLPDAQAAWPATVGGRSPGFRFGGYVLDAKWRPTFRYAFGAVAIEDNIIPKVVDVDVTLVRTLKLTGSTTGQVWFRAAAGDIKANTDGSYTVDGKLRLRFRGGGQPVVVQRELRVPVGVGAEFVEELTW